MISTPQTVSKYRVTHLVVDCVELRNILIKVNLTETESSCTIEEINMVMVQSLYDVVQSHDSTEQRPCSLSAKDLSASSMKHTSGWPSSSRYLSSSSAFSRARMCLATSVGEARSNCE